MQFFLDPVTSKFLLIVNVKCELYLGAFGKQNLLCHVLDIVPFLQLTFFSGIGFAHTGRYKPKTKRVCTVFKFSGSIYFLHKQLSRKELHKDAAESWKVWLTNATAKQNEASNKNTVLKEKNYVNKL